MASDRETLELDVLFVGAGPASLAGAIHLGNLLKKHNAANPGKKLELSIAVLEKGPEIGAHAISGAIVDPRSLRSCCPIDLALPFEAEVGKEHVWWLTRSGAIRCPGCRRFATRQPGRVARQAGEVDGEGGRGAGIDLFCDSRARDPARRRARGQSSATAASARMQRKANFSPVDPRRIRCWAKDPGISRQQLDQRLALSAGKNPQVYALGLKEVWELPKGRFEPGEIWHTMGWPLWPDHFGGGFLYGMKDELLIVGLVFGLDYENPYSDPHLEFQRLKTHPALRKLLDGGKMAYYGAKAIPESGYWAMPTLGGDGFA
jgi:electron-transferring-flavoprotein dehydrogenase